MGFNYFIDQIGEAATISEIPLPNIIITNGDTQLIGTLKD